MTFRVDLDVFRGPLDLLLYLVRKHEVEIVDIPIAPITDQFLAHLAVLEQINVNAVGDFLEMASWLIEIKSRMVLPRGDEVEEAFDDPRQELVARLLEYKKYKDAASMLDERGRMWQERYPRAADDLQAAQAAEAPLREVELWDLVSAFSRIVRETSLARPSSIVYDDTPIHVYMGRIVERLRREGTVALSQFFPSGLIKSAQIGMFLAVLELVRHHHVQAEQNDLFGEIWLLAAAGAIPSVDEIDATAVDNYEHGRRAEEATTAATHGAPGADSGGAGDAFGGTAAPGDDAANNSASGEEVDSRRTHG
jgi:segregation and condensation protein A